MKEAKVRTLFSKLRFSILYFIYAFEIHRPNVNSALQSSLNWNKTISVINVLCSYCPFYAVLCHSTLVSNLLSTYPISTPTCRARLCQREHVLSCPVLSPTSEEDLHINKRDQFSFETADTVKRVCYEYCTKPLLFNSLIQRYRWLK